MNGFVIETSCLSFAYPDGVKALDNVNFSVRDGECVGIAGGNGTGKSTLLLTLNGTLRGEGTVKIAGLKVNDRNIYHIRKKVGLVFQNPDDQLFMPTVFDDVSFGPINMDLDREEIKVRTDEALAIAGVGGYASRSSHHLSFGEKKRVSFATVLSMKPEIILLDEPTANLDPTGRREFMDFLKTVGGTRVIASHDMDMLRALCPRTVLLHKGRITADGPTEEVLSEGLL